MVRKTISGAGQPMLFTQEEMSMKAAENGSNALSFNLRDYLHSREGLWRLMACMPQDMSVVEALRQAPRVIFGLREEGGAL